MTHPNLLALIAMECGSALTGENDIYENLRAAMRIAKDHWMVTDREAQFRGALAAVMTHYGPGSVESERIESEIRQLRRLSAFVAAAQAGLSPTMPESEPTGEPLNLSSMWQRVLSEGKR